MVENNVVLNKDRLNRFVFSKGTIMKALTKKESMSISGGAPDAVHTCEDLPGPRYAMPGTNPDDNYLSVRTDRDGKVTATVRSISEDAAGQNGPAK